MVYCQLIEAKTKDGLTLVGLHIPPRRKRAVLVWVPGLGGTYTSHLTRVNVLARALGRRGVGFAVFNTRGSYTVAHLKAKRGKFTKRIAAGMAFERFTDCVHDLDAMVSTMRSLGYRKIFLAGHSTGANKVAYYGAHTRTKIAGAILLGPVSDIPTLRHELGRHFLPLIKHARAMVRQGRGDELLTTRLAGTWFWSARRFLSLAVPRQAEDTFPYYDTKRRFPWVKRWHTPLLVVLGSQDEFLDRSAVALRHSFNEECVALPDYTFRLIHKSDHGFSKHRAALGRCLAQWMSRHL